MSVTSIIPAPRYKPRPIAMNWLQGSKGARSLYESENRLIEGIDVSQKQLDVSLTDGVNIGYIGQLAYDPERWL